jgi:hypothetical protein
MLGAVLGRILRAEKMTMADRTKPEHLTIPSCILCGRSGYVPGHNKEERQTLRASYLKEVVNSLWNEDLQEGPQKYMGVTVPETLRPNWNDRRVEVYWWRKGVEDAMNLIASESGPEGD